MTRSISERTRSDPDHPPEDAPNAAGSMPDTSRNRALWLTLLSVLTPGVAHWHAGKRRTAAILATVGGIVWVSVAVAVATAGRTELISLAVRPTVLMVVVFAAVLAIPAWMWLVVSSYRAVRPRDPRHRTLSVQFTVLALCMAVAVPPTLVAHFAYAQYDLVTTIFNNNRGAESGPSSASSSGPSPQATQPIPGVRRLNVLLLGSDAGPGRTDARTDTMVLASIDQTTGRTVLFGLPRNLQNVPMPPGQPRDEFPEGYSDLLNAVYREGHETFPEYAGDADDVGAELLKDTVSETMGIPVHHHATVNMEGFQDLVDALGGLDINVAEPTPMGETGEWFQPGEQRLDGEQALWYARSRTDGSDYDRMDRQRCMLNGLSQQADPVTVLNHYHQVADATKDNFSTDIPADMLQDLVGLADKITPHGSVQFTPPLVETADPDFDAIRSITQDAIERSEAAPPEEENAAPAPEETEVVAC